MPGGRNIERGSPSSNGPPVVVAEYSVAMSGENVEAVRQVNAFWARGEWAATAELFDPDVEVVFSATAFPDPGIYRGGRMALDAWAGWLEAWEDFSFELEDVIEAGESIVTLNRLRGRGKASGVTVDADVGCIFHCDRGRVVRMVFCDRREALKAAGRSDPRG
jgi:ketosteroid isomerase-like protein